MAQPRGRGQCQTEPWSTEPADRIASNRAGGCATGNKGGSGAGGNPCGGGEENKGEPGAGYFVTLSVPFMCLGYASKGFHCDLPHATIRNPIQFSSVKNQIQHRRFMHMDERVQ